MSMRNITAGFRAKSIIILLLNIAISGSYAESLKEEKVRESYVIGKSGLNRITMLPHKIVSVAGDNSQYKLQSDKDGSSIYIMPIAKVNQKIELSVRSDVGEIRDLELEAVAGPGRTVKLCSRERVDCGCMQRQDIKKMISSMQKKEKGDYRVRKLNRNIANNYNLKIIQKASYRYRDLRGGVLEVRAIRPRGRSLVSVSDLNAGMFADLFEGVVATSIGKEVASGAVSVFVVTSAAGVGKKGSREKCQIN